MDFVSPILDITCRLCGCIGNSSNYIRHLQDNLKSLRNELEKLIEQRNDLRRRVEIAERQEMQRTEQVKGWLRRAEQLEREVEVVLQKGDAEIQRKCLKICPRNCRSSHKLGKKVSKKLQAVADLKSEGNFSTVAVTLTPSHAEEMPLETTVGLDSKVNKVLSFIRDDDGVGIVGIYGMGGVGKTTLLKKLNNELATQFSGEFAEVIWVVVSKDLIVERAQDKIGEKLGFPDETWSKKSQDQKREGIFRVLKRKKFVLLLDDIWERLDLLEVGVPLPNNQNKAKVVFTTRSADVCGLMGAQKKIKVECLAWQEAWDLFKDKVGEETLNSNPAILELSHFVCKECAGLPLALITVGRAMASKRTHQEWNYAIGLLRKSTSEFSGMGDKVFPLLKFSYDSLPDDITRTCFLYCSLFPEGWYSNISNLIVFWIGEGFFDECDRIDEAYTLGHDIIGRLKLACLLETDEYVGGNYVAMHDMIRDMALWIVSESGSKKEKYLVQVDLKLTAAPANSKWGDAERISLIRNSIEELSGTPRCPNLLTLNLRFNALRTIADSFFQFMPVLKVLDLSSNKNLTHLPESFFTLVSLQHLDLSKTGIRELPIEFKLLVKLKHLFLRGMYGLVIIPPQVISSLLMLQRLELFRSGVSEGIDDVGNIFSGGNERLLDETECLNHLYASSLIVKSELALQKFSRSQKLQSCTFGLDIEVCRSSTSLQLSSLQKNNRLEWLDIGNCGSLEELSIDWATKERDTPVPHNLWDISSIMDGSSFQNLRGVRITKCKALRDLTWLLCLPTLQTLLIYKCKAMEEVIKDVGRSDEFREGSLNVFSRLRRLTLYKLPELKSICSLPLPFPSLKEVQVFDCPKLKKLPFDCNSGKDSLGVIGGQGEWWDKLEWENETTCSVFFPNFSCQEAPTEGMIRRLFPWKH
ncbi:probable disease resistance protein At5g63020 [Cornus florida]|uniref:probable disease resistance protein At5g63020 n=1 Tax=Cornus florida TaxID=4283 RepID=UPI0028A0C7D8|nr:probable disease resistance protein At5g63020 [Cornus florida]